jgi:hypothetical protein
MPPQRTRKKAATGLPADPRAPVGFDGDVFIQAGHENTPDNKTGGEGPLKLAALLGINSDPRVGGFNDKDLHDVDEGAVHIVFPGSSDLPARSTRTQRTAAESQKLGQALFAQLCRQ